MKYIIKKGNKKENFDENKLKGSVQRAAISAGISPNDKMIEKVTSDVIRSFEGESEVSSDEIRERLLSGLDEMEPSISESWRNFDEKYKS